MELSGAEILIECLRKEKVEVVFGYPGGAVLPIYDVLYDADIRHVLVRHEQGAAHAADGYARATAGPACALRPPVRARQIWSRALATAIWIRSR